MKENTYENNCNPFTIAEFCAGYCGLGMGVDAALGGNTRTIVYCEREAYAVKNICTKIEEGRLDEAPIYTDLTSFPYRKFRGLVDIILAGIPCQPHSSAGNRKGGSDERFLFDIFFDGLEQMQPGIIFIENVDGLLSSKMPDGTLCFGYVMRRLEEIGYCIEEDDQRLAAGVFSAVEAGAPHQRKRVFIMAHRKDFRCGRWQDGHAVDGQGCEELEEEFGSVVRGEAERCSGEPAKELGDSQHNGSSAGEITSSTKEAVRDISEGKDCSSKSKRADKPEELADSRIEGSQRGIQGGQDQEWEGVNGHSGCDSSSLLRRWPARPQEEQHGWEEPRLIDDKLNSDWVEQLMGIPVGWTDLNDGDNHRTDRLRLCGNGVVPDTASIAFITLLGRTLAKYG